MVGDDREFIVDVDDLTPATTAATDRTLTMEWITIVNGNWL